MAAKKQAIGVIGLGIIGSRVAANLRRSGHEVWVWNRSPKAEPNFLSSAAEVAETADILLIFVSDGPALIEVIGSMESVLAARHLIVNHSTISPDEARDAARLAEKSSTGFLDAPFTGSRDAAEAGQLVYYVSGSSEWIERAHPVLSASARSIIEVGGEIGQASLIKLATNLVAATTVEALAEAMALVDAGGVSAAKFLEAFAQNAVRSGVADMKLPCMITGDFEPRFSLRNMSKDVQLALQTAQNTGVKLPAAGVAAELFAAGIQQGWGDMDFSAVAKHYGFPGREPLITNALATSAGDAPQKPKRFSFFGTPREA